VYVKHGESEGRKVLFVFLPEGCDEARLKFAPRFLDSGSFTDLLTGESVRIERDDLGAACTVRPCAWRVAVLVQE
jgi:hypothetical protein